MSKIKSGIRKGTFVKQGDVIGYVGSTGLATGPHVCYRFWKNGRQVDPYKEKLPPSKPMKEKSKQPFKLVKDSLIQFLSEPII
jgi:murein DD-endopeptidase MepM/ murein hydrolase activator NlpD